MLKKDGVKSKLEKLLELTKMNKSLQTFSVYKLLH